MAKLIGFFMGVGIGICIDTQPTTPEELALILLIPLAAWILFMKTY